MTTMRKWSKLRSNSQQKKFAGMQQEAKSFDTQAGKGSLRNILSLGDMFYERDALMQLAASRRSELLSSERLCAKSLLLPRNPRLSQLTATLRACKLLLPAIMESGTNIDIDFDSAEPMPALAGVLGRPGLAKVPLPGRRDDHDTQDDAGALRQLAKELQGAA
jgi:hypothetical protein